MDNHHQAQAGKKNKCFQAREALCLVFPMFSSSKIQSFLVTPDLLWFTTDAKGNSSSSSLGPQLTQVLLVNFELLPILNLQPASQPFYKSQLPTRCPPISHIPYGTAPARLCFLSLLQPGLPGLDEPTCIQS